MDADGLSVTYACAMAVEEKIARRLGPTTRLGLGAVNGIPPEGRLVSFGIAGALRDDLEVGTVIDATRVVDEAGAVLWEGPGLGVGRPGTILAMSRLVDDPAELQRLREQTGADAVDMESGVLASTGRLRGCIRSVSDTPDEPLGPLALAVTPEGRPRPLGFLKALATEPAGTLRALGNVRRALKALEGAA